MDSMDRKIQEAASPRECMEPSNIGRLIEKMKERDEAGHVYLTLRAAGLPHDVALQVARGALTKMDKMPPPIRECVELVEDIEPLEYMNLN